MRFCQIGMVFIVAMIVLLIIMTFIETVEATKETMKDKKMKLIHIWQYTRNFRYYPLGDINQDCIVNIKDLDLITYSFGEVRGTAKYVSSIDINQDGKIDIFDMAFVGKRSGNTC